MCPVLDINKTDVDVAKSGSSAQSMTEVHSQLNCTNEVLLQTLHSVVRNGNKSKEVRMLLDPGSQKSYILEKTALAAGSGPGSWVWNQKEKKSMSPFVWWA